MNDENRVVIYTPTDHDVAVIRFDDGKANALTHEAIDQLHESLSRAERVARAVLIEGRPGRFCAGFDLSVMQQGPDQARELLRAGAELALRVYGFPTPVVMSCTGHALAMGAILLMTADVRVGTEGEFKIGMNEVSIGMPVPQFATELARDRLARTHFTRAVELAQVYSPMEAVEAGYLDEVSMPTDMQEVAGHRARQLATNLDPDSFRTTRANARRTSIEYIRAKLDDDVGSFTVSTG